MATALAIQLATIKAKSTNPLDLKAQKKAHSQSLLFEPGHASSQDFGTIFQLCFEGFSDLCQSDTRYMAYSRSLFSEQSKQEDRTFMTSTQNQQLDGAIESFLGLVGSKLLLKPALKAVEWLVRRFRVHEYNTQAFILTFLPYYSAPIFASVLSILPGTFPHTLRFLQPYIQSLACPPRHAIAHAASNNKPFLTALNAYVLNIARAGYHYPALISFWATITTEAVVGMYDQARSARLEARKQQQEDILLFLLPLVNEALSVDNVPKVRVGSYMMLTALASETSLDDDVLAILMKAVVVDWSSASHAGLICIAVLSEQMRHISLPSVVVKALLSLHGLKEDLETIRQQYKVDKLVLGLVRAVAARLQRRSDSRELRIIGDLFEARLMEDSSCSIAIEQLLSIHVDQNKKSPTNSEAEQSLMDMVLGIKDNPFLENQVHGVRYHADKGGPHISPGTQQIRKNEENLVGEVISSANEQAVHDKSLVEDSAVLMAKFRSQTTSEVSFLLHSESYLFDDLEQLFRKVSRLKDALPKVFSLPVWRKASTLDVPLYFSFYVKIWCGTSPVRTRALAIRAICEYIKEEKLSADPQFLLPYIVYGLSDLSDTVRRATADLILQLTSYYVPDRAAAQVVLGQDIIYGAGGPSRDVSWLSPRALCRLFETVLVPGLEECLLDYRHICRLLISKLNGSRPGKVSTDARDGLKTSSRCTIFAFFCSHAVHTPIYALKVRLLHMLNQLDRVGGTSRYKLLSSELSTVVEPGEAVFVRALEKEHVPLSEYLECVIGIITPFDREGVLALKQINQAPSKGYFGVLQTAAHQHLRKIWSAIKPDIQLIIADSLLQLALAPESDGHNRPQCSKASETLTMLPLSPVILGSLLKDLPTLLTKTEGRNSPVPKRRRIHEDPKIFDRDPQLDLSSRIKHVALVLEMVENAQFEGRSGLLKGLFDVLADLQLSQALLGNNLGYLQVLVLNCLHMLFQEVGKSVASNKLDPTFIRADTLIDCVTTTSSPQARNTGLLLVSDLANLMPELILHNLMPIFTFIGPDVLGREDDFSMHVIQRTMESIIPRLVQSLQKRRGSSLSAVAELLLSFVAAYEHINPRRRLQLYTSLIDMVGSSQYLFAFLAILLDKYPKNRGVVLFAADISTRYPVGVLMSTLNGYLSLLVDAINPKPKVWPEILSVDVDENRKERILNLCSYVAPILSTESLIIKARKEFQRDPATTRNVREQYESTLENTFNLLQASNGSTRLQALGLGAVDALLGLLPLPDLIQALEKILAHSSESVRHQILRSFERRIKHEADVHPAQKPCLRFLPRLILIAQEASDFSLKVTAIDTMEKIIETFGKKDHEAVMTCAQAVASRFFLSAPVSSIRIASYICLTTAIEAVGDASVTLVPLALPSAIEQIEESMSTGNEDATLHKAAYSLILVLLEYVPWMITRSSLEHILSVSNESANSGMGGECDRVRVQALALAGQHINPHICIAALSSTWVSAMTKGPVAVKEYMELLRLVLEQQAKKSIVQHVQSLGDLFLEAFDLRRIQLSPRTEESYEDFEIDRAEKNIIDSAIALVYKLNDATFRPFFLSAIDWASTSLPEKDVKGKIFRRTTWYTFLLRFFNTLKSIVTKYASLIIDDVINILANFKPEDADAMLLWRRVIQVLQVTFENDQDEFYHSPPHFNPISSALLSQISHAERISVQPLVIPAVVELAVVTDSSIHHKDINAAILSHMRSDSAAVRLAAVQCERALTDRLGEEWLGLLSQMLPFIHELLEDDDELVDRETHRWVQRIEEILGESLNPMLQ